MNAAERFPPHVLRDYALIADGERGALVGADGNIAFLCAPRWDSDAVFATLVGGGGAYSISPDDTRKVWGGYYEPGSLIWRSRWATTDGIVESRDALAYPSRPNHAVVMRRVRALDRPARVRVVLEPAAGFGTEPLRDVRGGRGIWTARTGKLSLRWTGASGARRTRDGWSLVFSLDADEQRDLVLELSDQALPEELPDPDQLWSATEHAWSHAVPRLEDSLAPLDTRHSYAVLRGLTGSNGGMVAAATMSLPERAEAGRNYDYRYVWIRDQAYAGQASAAAGSDDLLDSAVRFVSERLLDDGPQLKPAYCIDGSKVPGERRLRHLTGYPGGADRIGNHVNTQFQLDAFGEALLLLSAAAARDRLESHHWTAAETAVHAIEQRWTEPDAGIWELDPAEWTHSRLTCVAGLRAIAQHATGEEAGRWSTLADTILGATARAAVHPTGRWQRAPDDDKVDAALLLPTIRGAIAPDDPRAIATLHAVRDELTSDHFVYRFRQQPGPLADAEGAFVLCGFVMSLAEQQQGRHLNAIRYFERNRTACGTPGLFSEEYDVTERQLRGNLPQAFVHALLLESSVRLAQTVDDHVGTEAKNDS